MINCIPGPRLQNSQEGKRKFNLALWRQRQLAVRLEVAVSPGSRSCHQLHAVSGFYRHMARPTATSVPVHCFPSPPTLWRADAGQIPGSPRDGAPSLVCGHTASVPPRYHTRDGTGGARIITRLQWRTNTLTSWPNVSHACKSVTDPGRLDQCNFRGL